MRNYYHLLRNLSRTALFTLLGSLMMGFLIGCDHEVVLPEGDPPPNPQENIEIIGSHAPALWRSNTLPLANWKISEKS